MPLFAKTTSTNWASVIPWYKATATSWLKPSRVHLKTGVSTWTEVWPRQPGTPTALVRTPIYRNDRIEIDFSWTAASGSGTTTTPVATSTYNVFVYINGASVYSTSTASTSFTLTNSGSGYQNYAGQSLYFTVQAVSAAGVLGPLATSSTTTVPQLPAPPQVTSVAQSLSYGDLSYSWAHVGGNRLTGFQVNVYGPVGNGTYYYGAATSVSASGHPWSGGSVNGGNYQVDIYPYGPGGYGPVYTFTGSIPGDVVFTNTRMYTNDPPATVSSLTGTGTLGSNSTSYLLYWNQEGGANNLYGSVGAGNISLGPGTIGYSIDVRYRWIGVPQNAYGTGRVCGSPFVRRIRNPMFVQPLDSQTWFNGGFGAPGNTVLQGWDAGTGSLYYGYYFYGNQFRDSMNDSLLGFHLGIFSAHIEVQRTGDSSPYYETPYLWLHTAGSRGEANNGTWGGGVALTAIPPDNADYGGGSFGAARLRAPIDVNWIRYLIDQTNGWKGFGFWANWVGDNSHNIRLYAAGTGAAFTAGNNAANVVIYHDG